MQNLLPKQCLHICHGRLILCCNLQDQEVNVILNGIQSATLYRMPKLLACYEYHITQELLSNPQSAVVTQCMNEQLLSRSWAHIAQGLSMAFNNLKVQAASEEQCNCYRCQHYGVCSGTSRSRAMIVSESARWMPGPKDLYKFAAADNMPK